MSEYIEKMETILSYQETVTPLVAMTDRGDREFVTVVRDSDVVAFLEQVKPADVRPVVRGKWEVVDWVEYDGHGECVHYPKEGLCCTNCKNVFKKKLLWKDNYCPNCGAEMREEAEE